MANLVLVDDHVLLRQGLAGLINDFGDTVLFEADNGEDFISKLEKLDPAELPEVVLMDINMPVMDGYDTCKWLKKNYPAVKVLALSMYDAESSIIKMLNCGARGFILKDFDPPELKTAIKELAKEGYYYSGFVNPELIDSINRAGCEQGSSEQ